MYPGDWESLTKASSPLAAGLFEEEKKKSREKEKRDKHRDEGFCVERHKSKDFEPNARSLAAAAAAAPNEGRDGEEERGQKHGDKHSDKDSLLRQVKRMIVERVQHELSKVDHMIQERIHRETQSLRLQMESLQRDVTWLRAQADAQAALPGDLASAAAAPCHTCGPAQAAEVGLCLGPKYEDLASVSTALKKAKQGIEAQVSDLWTQIAAMQEGLEATHLRHKLRFVATSMLALGAADLSQEEKEISKRALQEEEAALKERLQSLAERLSKQRSSQGSVRLPNGAMSSNSNLSAFAPSRAEASLDSNYRGFGSTP